MVTSESTYRLILSTTRRLRHQIATATERFRQANEEKQGLLVLFGTLQTITAEDRKEFLEQIEAEQEAYEAI
jgi:hypothetical protein